MSENERELVEGLRALASAEPREASSRIEKTLLATFRARAERRRRAVWGSVVVAGGIAAMLIVFLWVSAVQSAKRQAASVHPAVVATAGDASEPDASEPAVVSAQYALDSDDPAASFYPLPEADGLPPAETTMVVRVEMPLSSLRLMGLPFGESSGADLVQADVLLGQDGLARGVRLIQ